MRVSLIISFVLILTFPFWGTYTFFYLESHKIRTEVRKELAEGIDKKKLVHLEFKLKDSEKELTWKNKREFEFKGHMYDLVSRSIHSDSVIIVCYKDQKETRLNEEIKRQIARAIGQDPSRKSHSEKLTDFFKCLYSQNAFSMRLSSPPAPNLQYSILNLQFSSYINSPLSPPPKRG